ncbi:hypothetical protein [Pedobacter sp. V48]|uniref:hypothetical protein n=1 Tax=Pedobacter sp. V48 TaxID=509635 RepID=UPI0003E4A027|nr:hypothetical protein [Pedobacter sp. V48]ETZ21015.1 hypothetical protein N824_02565 [Pedobacter sp. V48]
MILCCVTARLNAQHSFAFNNGPAMHKFQDTLIRLNNETFNATSNSERYTKNAAFIKTLVNSLKTQGSFLYPFDSLKKITILKSPDNSFRILSWYLPLDDGSYRFFGTIQMATKDGKLKMFPLIDDTANIKDTNLINGNKNWYGARYYEIIPVIMNGQQPYYVLIGWKGNSSKTSKKVIDVLSFNKEQQPVFGKPVFEDAKKSKATKNRIVFEYNKQNTMTVTLDKNVNMIVFDHLAPISEEMMGNFEYYASDLSFDAYKLLNGRLKLVENIELKNEPNEMDDLFSDPKDKKIKAIKKL